MINPDTYDRLRALYKRFDRFPDVAYQAGGVVVRKEAWLAFLDARKLILDLADDVHAMSRGWQPIASFFEAAPETPTVLLWAELPESGEFGVTVGWWDDDSQAWFRECEGPDCECAAIVPSKWMRIGDLSLPQDEFVAVPRLK